jgi:hypothetical protein
VADASCSTISRVGTYGSAPIWRAGSRNHKAGGGHWGILTVRGRVDQQVAKIVLEPILAADLRRACMGSPAAVGHAAPMITNDIEPSPARRLL